MNPEIDDDCPIEWQKNYSKLGSKTALINSFLRY